MTASGDGAYLIGDRSLLTAGRRRQLETLLASDPRVATVSLVASVAPRVQVAQATGPAGPVVAVSTRFDDLLGRLFLEDGTDPPAGARLREWSRLASDRGLRHIWWLVDAADVRDAESLIEPTPCDRLESADPTSAVWRATGAVGDLDVTVYAGWLAENQTGAQVVITKAVEGLSRDPRVRTVRLVGIDRLPTYADHLAELPGVHVGPRRDTTKPQQREDDDERSDVVWYPHQPDRAFDIGVAHGFGRRIIITWLDLIAYDIASYHASEADWQGYRHRQRLAALAVDGVTAISADVANRLCAEVPLLSGERVRTIRLGVDHLVERPHRSVTAHDRDLDAMTGTLAGREFVLVLGNDFSHKNRDFAVRVWSLAASRGFTGDLVLAGLNVGRGGSTAHDIHISGALRERVHVVGHVTSKSREWLLSNAAAVLYPSSAEGFGLVPYESAALGTPVVFTGFGPLNEVSGINDVPRDWSIDAHASDLLAVLRDTDARERRVAGLRAAKEECSWSAFSTHLVDFLVDVMSMPPTSASMGLRGAFATLRHVPRPNLVLRLMRRATRRAARAVGRVGP